MNELELRAQAIMREKDDSLTKNFVTIVRFLSDHEGFRPNKRASKKSPNPKFGDESYLEWLANKYIKGREPSDVPMPNTVADPALSKVLAYGYPTYMKELLERGGEDATIEDLLFQLVEGHRIAMVAENVIGELLERYIDDAIGDDDWIWCAGEVVKSVDFIRVAPSSSQDDAIIEWESLQIKNRDNSENSSSSAIRKGTTIKKWHRTKSKTGDTCWDNFPVKPGDIVLSEPEFQKFIAKYFSPAEFDSAKSMGEMI